MCKILNKQRVGFSSIRLYNSAGVFSVALHMIGTEIGLMGVKSRYVTRRNVISLYIKTRTKEIEIHIDFLTLSASAVKFYEAKCGV